MKKIQILMSTYNGEQYLKEQVESILCQEGVEIELLIRDDGSTDGTRKILKKFMEKYKNITVFWGENVGWKKSFFWLLVHSGKFEYYAFSDQDDIWLPEKMKQAVGKLEGTDKTCPVLYQSISALVDEKLQPMEDMKIYREPENAAEALLNAWTQGSNMVFNKKARDMAKSVSTAGEYPHDMWIYLICYFAGIVIFDKTRNLLYRQHANNVTAGRASGFRGNRMQLVKQSLKRLRRQDLYYNYSRGLYELFADSLKEEKLYYIRLFAGYKNHISFRIKLLLDRNVKKRTRAGTVALKMAILFSQY